MIIKPAKILFLNWDLIYRIFKSVVLLYVASIFLQQLFSLLFPYDFDAKGKAAISFVIQNVEMVGMMLLKDDINFSDIKNVEEPTDHLLFTFGCAYLRNISTRGFNIMFLFQCQSFEQNHWNLFQGSGLVTELNFMFRQFGILWRRKSALDGTDFENLSKTDYVDVSLRELRAGHTFVHLPKCLCWFKLQKRSNGTEDSNLMNVDSYNIY